MQGFQPPPPPEGDFGQQGFQYQEQQPMAEPAPGPSSGAQPPCPMPNKTTKLVALQCPQVSCTGIHQKVGPRLREISAWPCVAVA